MWNIAFSALLCISGGILILSLLARFNYEIMITFNFCRRLCFLVRSFHESPLAPAASWDESAALFFDGVIEQRLIWIMFHMFTNAYSECWIPRHTWNQLFQCGTAKKGGTRQRQRRRRHQTQQLDNIGFGKHNTFFSSTSSFFFFFFDDDRRKRVKMSICIAVKRSGRDRFGSSYDELSYVNYPARLIAVNESKAREGH